MAELADAADLKSAGLKKLVGVRVPLSAPTLEEIDRTERFGNSPAGADPTQRNSGAKWGPRGSRFAHARKAAQLKIRRAQKARGGSSPPLGTIPWKRRSLSATI